jgi:tRNA threonylcarbamoyladenosine biosynthesis protein TsaB
MNILALEFSSPRRSVALLRSQDEKEPLVLAKVEDENYRGTTPMDLIASAFKEAGASPGNIEMIAIGLGPGSYTGIRSAISLAQGWQLGKKIELIGVGTVEVLIVQAQEAGIRGEVTAVIDAQRGELYRAKFLVTEVTINPITPLAIKSIAETKAELPGKIIGPEAARWFPEGLVIHPSAIKLAHLALKSRMPTPGESLEPIYLREVSFVKAPPPRILQ